MRSRWTLLIAGLLTLAVIAPLGAAAKRGPGDVLVPTLPAALRRSRSLGFAWHGSLSRGVRLQANDNLRFVTEYEPLDHYYGSWQLVQLLERSAQRVAIRMPG